MRILYIAPFTVENGDHDESGVVGYGLTTGRALLEAITALGHEVEICPRNSASDKLTHVSNTYQELARRDLRAIDAILLYNCFHQFSGEIRRILYDRTAPRPPFLAGYTHGSHWDPTDRFRFDEYPALRYVDLGNVLALDLVFLVSQHMHEIMSQTIRQTVGEAVLEDFCSRARIVGLPINTAWIDRLRADPPDDEIGLLYNHSPTVGKAPEVFFTCAEQLLADYPNLVVDVTRRFRPEHPGSAELGRLLAHFPDRVRIGGTLRVDDYFRLLWRSRIQVSTARHESLGVATLEAMYANCCCVLPDRGAYPEITGGVGLYETDDDLLPAVAQYLDEPRLRSETAARQRKQSARYRPEIVAQNILDALTAQLGASGASYASPKV